MDQGMGTAVSGCRIDTNVLIYHLAGAPNNKEEAIFAESLKSGSHISIITRIELLGWRKHSPASLAAAEELLQVVTEIPLSEEITQLCIHFRRAYPIKLPYAIIAATACHTGLPLMTRNTTDFAQIPELRCLNPFI